METNKIKKPRMNCGKRRLRRKKRENTSTDSFVDMRNRQQIGLKSLNIFNAKNVYFLLILIYPGAFYCAFSEATAATAMVAHTAATASMVQLQLICRSTKLMVQCCQYSASMLQLQRQCISIAMTAIKDKLIFLLSA